MAVKVQLSNIGNPDRRQDPSRPLYGTESGNWVTVDNVEAASAVCRRYIEINDLGGGNWPQAPVHDAETDEYLGYISYNGRFWPGEEDKPAALGL